MCEIAVLDPEQTSIEIADQLLYRFHDEQGDGVGMVAIHNRGGVFEYDTYKSTEPNWATVHEHVKRAYDNDAWRIVLHGRAGTSGSMNRAGAHPIHVDCSGCNIDWVVHNGSVRSRKTKRQNLIRGDHEFTTGVDTEIIAHTIGDIPEELDDIDSTTYRMRGNLNYLVFSENGVFGRFFTKYQVTDDFRITCKISKLSEHGFDRGDDVGWLLANPSEGGPEIETKEGSYNYTSISNRSSGKSSTSTSGRYNGTDNRWSGTVSDDEDSGGITVEYEDLLPDYDFMSAYKVAPGVIRVKNRELEQSEYVRIEKRPKVYYFYANENGPEKETLDVVDYVAQEVEHPVQEAVKKFNQSDEPDDEERIAAAIEEESRVAVLSGASNAVDDEELDLTVEDVAEVFDKDGNMVPADEV